MNIELKKYVNDFYELIKDIPYNHSGMFNNEVFMIYTLYKELNCNMFIESGIDNGVSTQRFLKFVQDEYVGLDWNSKCYGSRVNQENFTFTCADSTTIIPKLIESRKEKNILVMIDGPKGMQAANLKNSLLEYDNVKVVALHDTYDGLENENHLRIFETKNNQNYFEKYFNLLNLNGNNEINTIFNLKNTNGLTYHGTFPTGPGVSIYSKLNLNFIL